MTSFHVWHYSLFCYALALLVVGILLLNVYRAAYGPLAHLPGPNISRWTHLRLKLAVVKGERVRYVHELHQLYGPIVRISPHEVSLADVSAAKAIYKVGGPYVKTEWYNAFTGNQKEGSLFTMLDFYQHSQHRRFVSANFSEKSVTSMEPYIARNVRLATDRMAEEMDMKGYCDVFKWFTFMATDVIGEASFGDSFRMLETGQKNEYIHDLENVASAGMIRTEFPWLVSLMKLVPFGPGRRIGQSILRFQQYAEESVERYWRQLRADPATTKPTLLTKEYAGVEAGAVTKSQLRRDALGNIVAGTDTTAVAATNAVWLISQSPEIEQALIREVASLKADFTDHDLREIKLLQGVVSETLRLSGPISQSLPRLVPPGGAELCGYSIPEYHVVGVQSYTMHRDPAVWSHPEVFDPYRWDEPTKDMLHSSTPFGGGSRICIGMHFAQLELRHALANFYRTFDGGVRMSSADGFSSSDMRPLGFFLSPPSGGRCLVERRG